MKNLNELQSQGRTRDPEFIGELSIIKMQLSEPIAHEIQLALGKVTCCFPERNDLAGKEAGRGC